MKRLLLALFLTVPSVALAEVQPGASIKPNPNAAFGQTATITTHAGNTFTGSYGLWDRAVSDFGNFQCKNGRCTGGQRSEGSLFRETVGWKSKPNANGDSDFECTAEG